jgi:CheY-like chemotaxis protein
MDINQPVLVVDDYRSMARIIERLVRQLGFIEVDHARDGEAAMLDVVPEVLRACDFRLGDCARWAAMT